MSTSEVRLRVLTVDDVDWVVAVDTEAATPLAAPIGFDLVRLADELERGQWASDGRWGWAVMLDGEPAGFALVTGLEDGDGRIQIRLRPASRGRGVGREVLRKLADHHFADSDHLQRLVGLAHERNLPMQRAFNAAGFRMEARYRDSVPDPFGGHAAMWGYALTRRDWEAGRHHMDDSGYDLHGLVFAVEEVLDGPTTGSHGLEFTFWQDGWRVMATFASHELSNGELAGILVRDVLRYRYVQEHDPVLGGEPITGRGRLRIQRAADGRLQLINEWSDGDGRHGRTLLLQRSAADTGDDRTVVTVAADDTDRPDSPDDAGGTDDADDAERAAS